jgi:hypothetical protein
MCDPFTYAFAIVAVVPDHLFTTVRNMGAHGCQPFQDIKGFCLFAGILSAVADRQGIPVRRTIKINVRLVQ